MDKIETMFQIVGNIFFTQIFIKMGIIKTVIFFQNYLTTVGQIKAGNTQARYRICFQQGSLFFISFHYFLLYLFDDNMTYRELVLQFNWLHLNGLPAIFNLMGTFFVLYTGHLFSLMYFRNNHTLYRILQHIFSGHRKTVSLAVANLFNFRASPAVVNGSENFFWNSKSTAKWAVNRRFLGVITFSGALELKHLQMFAVLNVNLLNLIMLMTCKNIF